MKTVKPPKVSKSQKPPKQGGMGFVEETGAAQHMRDARILPIYEGTNGIQALDFIGRKCLRDGGEGLQDLLADMRLTVSSSFSESPRINALLTCLNETIVDCENALSVVLDDPSNTQYMAYNFMMLFGNSVCYWLMVRLSLAAQAHIADGSDDRFYEQKIATTEFFAAQVLPRNAAHLGALNSSAEGINAFAADDFYRH